MIKCGQINGARMLVIFTRGRFGFVSSLLIRFIVMLFSCAFSTFLKKKKKKVQQSSTMVIATSFYLFGSRKGSM